ncbi:toll/interleukin-1 receptor domain-containing protein [Rhodococcus sp. NCIMB 12038]|uniref:toll/interleukin-1 receptor domain-containing protein n=1 Tax=Rhodococcus sp. NCIMB 12038 TaxID=933800 RepID=UPI000B3C7E33|nr:TIR domain-containing protein [Rhodococcus sp. NCIMB 12038]OUS92858.1 hypothetical protein CA951_26360 [Rhodococcus sp. NCIMB 12038]
MTVNRVTPKRTRTVRRSALPTPPRSRETEHLGEFDYDAFISYTHHDRPVAAGIQKGLHRIGRKLGRLNALRVFRDATDVTASPDLWGKVCEAMDRSRYLIVVLSPDSVASVWVNKEVTYWLQQRGPDQLMFVVVAGHLTWDETTGRFDPDKSDVALPVLTQPGALAAEPFYVDVTDDSPWDPQTPIFREKVTDLAAPIHGKPKYELASDDLRELRRYRRVRRVAVAGLVVLTVIALIAAAVAIVQRQSAIDQRQEAIHQRNQAIALALAAESQSMLAGIRPSDARGLQQVLAAQALAPSSNEGALLDAVIARRYLLKVIEPVGRPTNAVFSPDGTRIVSGSNDKSVRQWDVATGLQIGSAMTGHQGIVGSVAFSPDGTRIVSGSNDKSVRQWDVATGLQIGSAMTGHQGLVYDVAFSPDGKRIVSSGEEYITGQVPYDPDTKDAVRQWDVATGRQIGPAMRWGGGSVAFSPDGQQIVGAAGRTVRQWDVATGNVVALPVPGRQGPGWSAKLSGLIR